MFPTTRIRCVVVDDHALMRHGVRRLLQDEKDFEVVGEAADGAAALEMVALYRPDLILMDIGMPGPSVFETTREIRNVSSRTKVVFLTMHEDEEYLEEASQAGAVGYLLKDTPAHHLVNALREIQRGGRYVSPELLRNHGMRTAASELTRREREIMKLLAEGNTVRSVAGMLGVSVKTVEAHKFNLMRKLDIHNKAQLVTFAIRNRILKMPPLPQ
jgi:DNA-binding NarL/FixJ family response regulator